MARKSPRKPRQTERRANTAADLKPAEDDYIVGPGRPPKQYQWKAGESGNPRGRKRKQPSMQPQIKTLLERALNRTVTLRQGGQERTLTMIGAGLEQLAAQLAQGDRHARRDAIALAERLGLPLFTGHENAISKAFAASADAALDDYVARQTGTKEMAASSPVLAPPELLDDDVDGESKR